MPGDRRFVIYAAAAANLAIAATKLGASVYTGSSAMLTEAIHSFVDTGDQGLLLLGKHRSATPSDERHPFGHGLEEYFWSFVVALMIFSLGGAVSIYEGVRKILSPAPITTPWVNFAVLGAAAVFEGASLGVTFHEFQKARLSRRGLWASLRASKDPGLFAVLLEDAAALLGLAIASVGLAATLWLGLDWADGAASIGIGAVLIAVALFLANETRSLLTGEAASTVVQERVRQAVVDNPSVERVAEVSTLQLGPKHILVALDVAFRGEPSASRAHLARAVKACDPRIQRVLFAPGEAP